MGVIHKGDETIIFREDDGFTFGLFRYEDGKAINKFNNILKIEKERYPLLRTWHLSLTYFPLQIRN